MFGLGKKPQRRNIIGDAIRNSIEYSITAKEESIPREPDDIPYLPLGQYNPSIPSDFLNSLPIHLQNRWTKIDFEKLFPQIEDAVEEAIEEAIELPEESVNLIRSITLAEIQARGEKEE